MAHPSERPVFVVGMPRSGTSLAEQILASHPSIYGAGELMYWHGAYEAYRRTEPDRKAALELIPNLAKEYLDRLNALDAQAARVVDKMPANFWYAGLLHAAFPNARIIHMQRHPFDTCLSIYFQNFFNIGAYAHDLADLAHFYGEYRRVMSHWRRVLPEKALLECPTKPWSKSPRPGPGGCLPSSDFRGIRAAWIFTRPIAWSLPRASGRCDRRSARLRSPAGETTKSTLDRSVS